MTNASPFRTQLEHAVNARHSRMNPFTEKWVNGELTRAQLGRGSASTTSTSRSSRGGAPSCTASCPDADARDFLLENIIEEESGTKHVDLLIRFGEACGVSRAEVERTRQLPTHARASPRGATRRRASPSTSRRPGSWSGSSRRCPASTSAIFRRSGPTTGSTTTRWSSSRSTSRPTRCTASAAIRSSSGTAPTPEKQAEAADAVREATEMRWQYMTGLHRAFVLKEDA